MARRHDVHRRRHGRGRSVRTDRRITHDAAHGTRAARLATAAVFLANGIGIGAWAASMPAFKARLALTDARLSFVLFAFAAGAVCAMPLAGLAASRVRTGATTRAAAPLFAATLVLPFAAMTLPAPAPAFAGLTLAAFLVGAASGALDVAMNAHASGLERRAPSAIMSSFHAAFSCGGLLGAGAGAAVALATGDAAGSMPVAAAVAAALLAGAWQALGPGDAVPRDTMPPRVRFAWPGRSAFALCVGALLGMLCEGAVGDWSAVYLRSVAGAPPSLAAAGYAAFSAAMLAGRFCGDAIVGRLGGANVVRLGAGLAAAGLALAAAVPQTLPSIAGFACVGLGLSNVVPVMFSAGGLAAASPAAGIALVSTAGYAGFLFGPPLVGAAASLAGLRSGMVLLALCAVAVAVLAGSVGSRATGRDLAGAPGS